MKKFALSLAALLVMVSPAMSAEKTPEALQVEILIFSGRPNPVFVVSDPAEIREIITLADSLPASGPASKTNQSKLGYTGIVVENLSTTRPDVQRFKVGHGEIDVVRKTNAATPKDAMADAAQAKARADGANSLETRLLSLARSKGAIDDRLVEHIKRSK
jgi:hypothetical protein